MQSDVEGRIPSMVFTTYVICQIEKTPSSQLDTKDHNKLMCDRTMLTYMNGESCVVIKQSSTTYPKPVSAEELGPARQFGVPLRTPTKLRSLYT